MSAAPNNPSLAGRLGTAVVNLRSELDVSRHVFRAGPAYVVRDPVSFQTHRFDPVDYQILLQFDGARPLGQIFNLLVRDGVLDADDEEPFYEFVVDLHQRNLLSLPVSDGPTLFRRFEQRRRAETISRTLGILFLRVPLINPDRFLSRTQHFVRWLFTFPALLLWLALAAVSGFIVIGRWDDLTAPVLSTFQGSNLLILWGTLIGLKVIHEFGHAYACKAFGGHVPEMGAFFVLLTPMAYVDASDSWSFTRMRQRAAVTLAGVYVESIVGALALVVWALTEPSLLNTIAYQIVLLATITTALFNLNPLLRYDAYYLVSDLSGIPNLRAHSQRAVAALLKRGLFGLRETRDGEPIRIEPGLAGFGLAQAAYRVVIMLSIGTVLVLKFSTAGLIVASLLVAMTIGRAVMALGNYLLTSDELIGRRPRAICTSLLLAVGAVIATGALRVPWPLDGTGVVSFERLSSIRAPRDGHIESIQAKPGQSLPPGSTLVQLGNPELDAAQERSRAEAHRDEIALQHTASDIPAVAIEAWATAQLSRTRLASAANDVHALNVVATEPLVILNVHHRHPGAYVTRGEEMMQVGAGAREAVFLLPAAEIDRLQTRVGDIVEVRTLSHPDQPMAATVSYISPAGTRDLSGRRAAIADRAALPRGTGPSRPAAEPYFEIRLALPDDLAAVPNSSVHARFDAASTTLATVMHRKFKRFLNNVRKGADA